VCINFQYPRKCYIFRVKDGSLCSNYSNVIYPISLRLAYSDLNAIIYKIRALYVFPMFPKSVDMQRQRIQKLLLQKLWLQEKLPVDEHGQGIVVTTTTR
jgi:hypothetical protein